MCVFRKRRTGHLARHPCLCDYGGLGDVSCGLNGEVSLAIARCRDFFFCLEYGVVIKFWKFVGVVSLIWEEFVKGHSMVLDGT